MSENSPAKRAIILAAGRGSRLRPYTDHDPKCMVPVLGRPMLTTMLESLGAAGIEETVLVVGYRADRIRDAYGDRFGAMRLTYVDNPDWETTNNLYSLWLARELMAEGFLLLEADLVFPPSVITDLLAAPHPDAAVVDDFRPPMNGTVVIADGDRAGRMVLERDQGPGFDPSVAEKTVNVYKLSGGMVVGRFLPELERWVRSERTDMFYEAVLAELVRRGELELGLSRMAGRPWAEIDDEDDLRLAERSLAAFLPAAE